MANPAPPTNGDGSLRQYTTVEVDLMGIRWRGVRDGSTPTLSFGINENRAEASCFIDQAEFNSAVYYFLGASKLYDGDTELSRMVPFRLPGRDGLVCTKITGMTGHKFTGKPAGLNWVEYEKVELKLLFESPKFLVKADADTFWEYERWVETDPGEATSETIATFGSNLKFKRDPALADPAALPDGIPIPTNSVNKVQPKDRFTTTMWRIPEDMADDDSQWMVKMYGTGEQNVVPLIGCVNSVTLHGRPPGTLFLRGVRRFLDVSPLGDGSFEYRIEFTWETLPSGWLNLWFASTAFPAVNGYYQATTGSYEAPADVDDGKCLYNVRDLRQVYEPGPYVP